MFSGKKIAHLTFAVGIVAASLSGIAILLHAFLDVSLASTVIVFAPLNVVLVLLCCTQSRTPVRDVFLQRLGGGAFAGLMGLIAYDLIRWLILISGTVPFNPFRAIEVFGLLILNTEVDTWTTKAVGWLFHIWNGIAFAVMYTLAFGPGRVWWAVAWSMILETAMIVTYPSMFRVMLDWPFISVSFIGHFAYGLAVGLSARGAVKA